MSDKVLAFPVQHSCPTCGRMCSPEDLSECLRCGQEYCSECPWECPCDRDAAEMVQRAQMTRDECTSKPECPCEFCSPELDEIARKFIEETFDRAEDLRVFGTPLPTEWGTTQ